MASFNNLAPSEKHVITLHLAFAIVCATVLLVPVPAAFGVRMLVLVIIYNLVTPLWGAWRQDPQWMGIWRFALILSLFQVFPDWFLSAVLHILAFPADGGFRIGAVSGYMAGLWAIPVFLIVFAGERVRRRFPDAAAYTVAGAAAFLLFAGSEQATAFLPMWQPVNVATLGNTAVYIVIPEILFGVSAFYAFRKVSGRSVWHHIFAAFLVMQLYLGSAAFFYLVVEKLLL